MQQYSQLKTVQNSRYQNAKTNTKKFHNLNVQYRTRDINSHYNRDLLEQHTLALPVAVTSRIERTEDIGKKGDSNNHL